MAALDDMLESVGVQVAHHFCDGTYIKECHIPAGVTLVQHAHSYAHHSVLVSGRVVLKVESGVKELRGYQALVIPANYNHAVAAIEDSIWLCIHATAETDPEKIDAVIMEGH